MTQLGQALREAGMMTAQDRLEEIAINVMAVHASSRAAASDALYAAVRNDAGLLCVLFEPYRELAMRRFLGGMEHKMRHYETEAQEKARGGAQGRFEPQNPDAPASRPGGGGQGHPDPHLRVAPAAPLPRPPDRRKAQAAVADVLRLSMLDSFKIEGVSIGDTQAGVARAWARREGRHVRWVTLLTANMPAEDKIRRWVTADDAEAMWRRSASAEDDAND